MLSSSVFIYVIVNKEKEMTQVWQKHSFIPCGPNPE